MLTRVRVWVATKRTEWAVARRHRRALREWQRKGPTKQLATFMIMLEHDPDLRRKFKAALDGRLHRFYRQRGAEPALLAAKEDIAKGLGALGARGGR